MRESLSWPLRWMGGLIGERGGAGKRAGTGTRTRASSWVEASPEPGERGRGDGRVNEESE